MTRYGQRDLVWIEARRRFRLSNAQVQLARELGMNPAKPGKLASRDQEARKQEARRAMRKSAKRGGREDAVHE